MKFLVRVFGIGIRFVHGVEGGNKRSVGYNEYGSFMQAELFDPGPGSEVTLYQLVADVPFNTFQPGTQQDAGVEPEDMVEVTCTGLSVTITGEKLECVRASWGAYMTGLARHLAE